MGARVILVGRKPTTNYAVSMVVLSKECDNIVLRARGRSIQKAIDASQLGLRKYIPEWQIIDVKLGTTVLEKDGGEQNISTIEIYLERKK